MTDSNSLDLARFEQLLDVHGPELARWPEALQGPAQELLATTPAAREARERALRLAALLDAVPELLPSPELLSRIASLPARHPRGWAAWWPFGSPVAPLMGWAAAAAFGLLVGSGSIPILDLSAGVDMAQSDADAEGSAAPLAAQGAESGMTEASREASAAELDAAGDEDWSDLELALGIGLEWEEEP
jgi:hypothetical protein